MICVYDIETYPNIFTFVFKDIKTSKLWSFEISSRKNQLSELISFLNTKGLGLIGYNNVYFDYPILHYILTTQNVTLKGLYSYVQNKIIDSEFSAIPEWKIKIPQCDLFKINHYDNKARRTSLKWLEFMLRWHKLQDLPFEPGTIIPEDKFDFLIDYNINDVEFTHIFYQECLTAIEFRQEMSKLLKKNVMNYSDVKIGEYLNQITYQKLSGLEYTDFKNLRTKRGVIEIRDLIPSFVKFKTPEMQAFLAEISSKSFRMEDKFERNVSIGQLKLKFAKGGLHSKDTPKVFKCKEKHKLKEKDVGSMYPRSIIAGKLFPEHLGKSWYEGIKLLYDERTDELKPKMKKLDKGSKEYKFLDAKQGAYKLAMNGGGYGKTGLEYSWQYDPLVMYKVTFKGQLALMMLLEDYHILGIDLISANTDGIVIHYPEDLEGKIQDIHDKWEETTKYLLEDTSYNQIIFRDVNNYIAEIIDEKTKERVKMKFKGCFEIDPDNHKNNSQRIVPIALKEYFINNKPIKDTICNLGLEFTNSKEEKEITTIFDYCRGVKKGFNTYAYAFVSNNHRENIHDKVIRYYISNSSTKLFKLYDKKDKRVESVNKGFNVTSFMNYEEKDDYDINYNYYINECKKIIDPIEKGTNRLEQEEVEQLKLF